MIKIIKSGYDKRYITVCWRCNTTFTYQREDVYKNICDKKKVKCPVCDAEDDVDYFEYSGKSKGIGKEEWSWLDE